MQFVLVKLPLRPRRADAGALAEIKDRKGFYTEKDVSENMKPVKYKELRDTIKNIRRKGIEPIYADHKTFDEIEESIKAAVRYSAAELKRCGVDSLFISNFILLMNDLQTLEM
jgi:hypothetical protein